MNFPYLPSSEEPSLSESERKSSDSYSSSELQLSPLSDIPEIERYLSTGVEGTGSIFQKLH